MLASAPAWAQVQITSSPNPVGSGARALGMGGAFIAIADDATAASWNPGGLTQLERPEVSLVLNTKFFGEDFSSGMHQELHSDETIDISDINYLSGVYPIQHTIAGRNLILSINFQKKYDFDRNINTDFRDIAPLKLGNIADFSTRVNYKQRGSLSAISPAFGIEITDKLSVGAVVNIYNEDLVPSNGWKVSQKENRVSRIDGISTSFGGVRFRQEDNYENFNGINYTLGTLYKPNPRWGIGVVYNSKMTADVDFTRVTSTLSGGSLFGISRLTRPMQYVFPASYGLGVSYRFPNDKLTLSADITRHEWDQFVIRDPKNPSMLNQKRSGVTGQPLAFAPSIDPTYTVRFGAEYVFVNPKKARQDYLPSLRAGVFYDPEPSGGRRNDFIFGLTEGDGKPEDFYGFSLGAGVLIKSRVNIDFAYTFRTGDGVRKDTFALPSTSADVTQHLFYLSTVIYF